MLKLRAASVTTSEHKKTFASVHRRFPVSIHSDYHDLGIHAQPKVDGFCGPIAANTCLGGPVIDIDCLYRELLVIWEKGSQPFEPGREPDYKPTGFLSPEAINAILGAKALNRDVTLVHVVDNFHTDTPMSKNDILSLFPADIHRVFMWFKRNGSIDHYRALFRKVVADPVSDDWYVVDSMDVLSNEPPRRLTDADWLAMRGTFYFFAQADVWTSGNFGYIPRQYKQNLPVDKTLLSPADISNTSFSQGILRTRATPHNWQHLLNETNTELPAALQGIDSVVSRNATIKLPDTPADMFSTQSDSIAVHLQNTDGLPDMAIEHSLSGSAPDTTPSQQMCPLSPRRHQTADGLLCFAVLYVHA